MRTFAKIISTIGNPICVGLLYGIYLQFFYSDSISYHALPLLLTAFVIVPVFLFILYQVKTGYFSDYDVSDKIKRNYLYKFVLTCFLILFAILIIFKFPIKATILVFVLLIHLSFSFAINQKAKVSLHTSINFLFAFFFIPLNSEIAIYLGLFGIINMWSRVELRRHKPSEVIYGLILGAFDGLIYLTLVRFFIA